MPFWFPTVVVVVLIINHSQLCKETKGMPSDTQPASIDLVVQNSGDMSVI